jgi:dihydroflavonol-4-reductase
MTRTLVTGGSGFIGQHLVPALMARGRNVRVLDLRSPEYAPAGLQFVKGSILEAAVVRDALDGVDEVYHLAGLPGMWMPDKNDFYAVNCLGTEIVLAAARERGVSRFLHCSTESILFSPWNTDPVITESVRTGPEEMPGAYTLSKMLAEQRAQQAAASGFPVVIVNPTMPIGPHRNLTPPTAMLHYFLNRRIQVYIDFVLNLVDVRDVAAGLVLAMERGRVGERYILGGQNISLRELLIVIGVISKRNALRIPLSPVLGQIAAKGMDLISDHLTHRPPLGTFEGVRIALHSKPLSNEKSQRELGYAPRPIEPALRDIVASVVGGVPAFGAAASYKSKF